MLRMTAIGLAWLGFFACFWFVTVVYFSAVMP